MGRYAELQKAWDENREKFRRLKEEMEKNEAAFRKIDQEMEAMEQEPIKDSDWTGGHDFRCCRIKCFVCFRWCNIQIFFHVLTD